MKRSVLAILDRLRSLQDLCATELRDGLEAMAQGDLTHEVVAATEPIDNPAKDELGQIADAVNGIRDRFGATIAAYNAVDAEPAPARSASVAARRPASSSASQQMASTSQEAGKAVGEIASAVGDVAQGAERQVRGHRGGQVGGGRGGYGRADVGGAGAGGAEVAEQARVAAQEGVGAAEQATTRCSAVRTRRSR